MTDNHRDHDAEMGPDDDRGQGPRLAQAARATLIARARNCWRSRPPRSPMCSRRGEAGTLRRIVAPDGATLPIGALLAVAGPDSVPDAEIDAFVAGFAVPEPAAEDAARGRCRSAARHRGRRPAAALSSILGEGDGAPVRAGARLRRRPQHLDVHPAGAGRSDAASIALDLPGHGGAAKEVGAGDVDDVRGRGRRTRWRHSASTGPISSAIRWAARSRSRWRCAGPSGSPR